MPALKVTRYIQEPGQCAIAASAAVGNYYNSTIDYELTKKIAKKHVTRKLGDGLWSGGIGRLLNSLGFRKVTIISSDLDYLDYSWNRLSQKHLLQNLTEASKRISEKGTRHLVRDVIKFLKDDQCQNSLKIDYHFGDYIRSSIDSGNPPVLCFNWTMFFKIAKYDDDIEPNAFDGYIEEHAVCAYGYNKKYVYISDSHHEYYKYSLAKYRKGKYRISWENLMTCMGSGDVILAENYDPEWIKE